MHKKVCFPYTYHVLKQTAFMIDAKILFKKWFISFSKALFIFFTSHRKIGDKELTQNEKKKVFFSTKFNEK
jgi:hypothetical protein